LPYTIPSNPETATLSFDNREIELPVVRGQFGDCAVNITGLYSKTGIMTFDPGFTSTASCQSGITYIDGEKGILLYRGYPIEQLAQGSYMESVYLLLHGELPDQNQLKAFEKDVVSRMAVHQQMIKILEGHTRDTHPMALAASMVTALGTFERKTDITTSEGRYEVALEVIAKIPAIIALAHRYTTGQPYIAPREDLGYTENFLRMCFAKSEGASYQASPALVNAMDRIFTLHADHEQNASTSTVRLAGSTGTEPYAALSAGIYALWGPKHGGANEAVLAMLAKIGTEENVPGFIEDVKGKKALLMGFGHRVYKNFDPRARIIGADCDRVLSALGTSNPLLKVARALEQAALKDSYFVERKLYPNVDFYSGVTLKAAGFPTSMFTPLFALARTTGWIQQWRELAENREPIGRPRQVYSGHNVREYVPLELRGTDRDPRVSIGGPQKEHARKGPP
jgi:citrate synthase